MSTLYEYIQQIDEIIAGATDEDGVIDYDSIKDELEALQMSRDEKVDNCIKYAKSRKAMAEALKNEKAAIAKRQKQAENEYEKMVDYIAFCLNGEKYESLAGKVQYRMSQKVIIEEYAQVPERYVRWKAEPDKVALREDLKKGMLFSGIHLDEQLKANLK